MPAKKGQKHRSYTYWEKKINKMPKQQFLEELFLPKYDKDRVWAFVYEKGHDLPDTRVKKLIRLMELKDREKLDGNAVAKELVDSIFNLKSGFGDLGGRLDEPLTNLEGLAIMMYTHMRTNEHRDQGGRVTENMTDNWLLEAGDLLLTDWDKLISYIDLLKE